MVIQKCDIQDASTALLIVQATVNYLLIRAFLVTSLNKHLQQNTNLHRYDNCRISPVYSTVYSQASKNQYDCMASHITIYLCIIVLNSTIQGRPGLVHNYCVCIFTCSRFSFLTLSGISRRMLAIRGSSSSHIQTTPLSQSNTSENGNTS